MYLDIINNNIIKQRLKTQKKLFFFEMFFFLGEIILYSNFTNYSYFCIIHKKLETR